MLSFKFPCPPQLFGRNISLNITFLTLPILLEQTSNLRRARTARPQHVNKKNTNDCHNLCEPLVGEVLDTDRPWDTDGAEDDRDGPLDSVNTSRLDTK